MSDALSRTERAVLRSLPADFGKVFAAIREDPAYLGDTVLAWHLERMHREGLVVKRGEVWEAVPRPERRREPRWLGGVLVTEDSPWRWDVARGAIRSTGVQRAVNRVGGSLLICSGLLAVGWKKAAA